MGCEMEMNKMLEERGKVHGDAWKISGDLISYIDSNYNITPMIRSGYFFAWYMVLNKLIRALKTPDYRDNWVDIIGFAQLALNDIEEKERNNVPF